MAAATINTGISIGQFLMAEDVNQAGAIALHLRQLGPHDIVMVRKILEENWEDEEQMVSNLLQFPFLIPEDIRIDSLKRGFDDLECPYYILSSAVGLQRINTTEIGNLEEMREKLKNACLHDIGMVAMKAFIALHPYLKYPSDVKFIVDILKRPRSTLFENALTWLMLQINDKKEMSQLLKDSDLTAEIKSKAERFIDDQFKAKNHGDENSFSLQFVDYIPSLNEFEAMLDKEDTLVDFFTDLDSDNDGKVSLCEVQSFLEDIGKKVSLEELKEDLHSIEIGVNDKIDKDSFIEIMFPRFQMK